MSAQEATDVGCTCRWLRPGGAVLPDRMALYVAAAGAGALDLAFWDDVQGFSYAPVRLPGTTFDGEIVYRAEIPSEEEENSPQYWSSMHCG